MSVLGSLHTSKVHDRRVAKLAGHIAELIAHSDARSAVSSDIVVLAVPYPALADVIA